MSELIEFASALAAKASPGPSGRVFRAWPWGPSGNDALMVLASSAGHALATGSVRAVDWWKASEADRIRLLTDCMRGLVSRAILPVMDRPIRSVLPKNGLWRSAA